MFLSKNALEMGLKSVIFIDFGVENQSIRLSALESILLLS